MTDDPRQRETYTRILANVSSRARTCELNVPPVPPPPRARANNNCTVVSFSDV